MPFLPPTAEQSEGALPERAYLNRELSWLAFNERVLAEAQDARNPLLERLKFAAIAGNNLDEFFMVRVAGIHRQIGAGVTARSPDGLTPRETLEAVRVRVGEMLRRIEKVTNGLLRLLREQDVRLTKVRDLGTRARARLRDYYLAQIQPVLTPLAVDPSHPFPYISNLSLNLAVILEGDEPGEREFARVKVPVGVLPRVVAFGGQYLLLEDVIAAHLGDLFRGRTVLASYLFRLTRNTDYEFEEEEAEDLLQTIEEGLRRRRFGATVRLEIVPGVPTPLRDLLTERLDLDDGDVFELKGPLGVADFLGWSPPRPDLSFPPFAPHVPDIEGEDGIFAALRARDVMLHHPYESFEGVLRFLESAATDPNVLAIKQTLYRTGNDARLLKVLLTAAENGKQVVALIELKARFDEQRNIEWARALERAGAHVVYGFTGLKIHAKVTLVVRREGDELRRYVHVGTGNYNPRTARLYTDLSLLTSDADVGEDAWIFAKMNSLTDPGMVAALDRASQGGVRVRLIVRGVCCLRPGAGGLSERVAVRSLLGRFLEHARVYAFGGGEVYFGSADLMSRNLNRRVEVLAPACSGEHRARLLALLETEWADERGSWELQENGAYRKLGGEFSAQEAFMRGEYAARD